MNPVMTYFLMILTLVLAPALAAAQQSGFSDVQGGKITNVTESRGPAFLASIVYPATELTAKASSEVPRANVFIFGDGWLCYDNPIADTVNSRFRAGVEKFYDQIKAAKNPVAKTELLQRRTNILRSILVDVTGVYDTGNASVQKFWPSGSNLRAAVPNCYSRVDILALDKEIEKALTQLFDTALQPLRDAVDADPVELGDQERIQ
ncbi:MAG: hypothetical protein P1U37_05280 [Minwuia sp.]|nr:hypothetical protein [Minwuia sp.]